MYIMKVNSVTCNLIIYGIRDYHCDIKVTKKLAFQSLLPKPSYKLIHCCRFWVFDRGFGWCQSSPIFKPYFTRFLDDKRKLLCWLCIRNTDHLSCVKFAFVFWQTSCIGRPSYDVPKIGIPLPQSTWNTPWMVSNFTGSATRKLWYFVFLFKDAVFFKSWCGN